MVSVSTFLISLGISSIFILLLVLHFKSRLSSLETKYEAITQLMKENEENAEKMFVTSKSLTKTVEIPEKSKKSSEVDKILVVSDDDDDDNDDDDDDSDDDTSYDEGDYESDDDNEYGSYAEDKIEIKVVKLEIIAEEDKGVIAASIEEIHDETNDDVVIYDDEDECELIDENFDDQCVQTNDKIDTDAETKIEMKTEIKTVRKAEIKTETKAESGYESAEESTDESDDESSDDESEAKVIDASTEDKGAFIKSYSKYSVQSLKSMVTSKGLCSDPSKLKRKDLLKLLDDVKKK